MVCHPRLFVVVLNISRMAKQQDVVATLEAAVDAVAVYVKVEIINLIPD